MSLAAPRFFLALAVFGYASICDVKAREVPAVWLVGFPTGLALTAVDVLAGDVWTSDILFSLAVAFAVGFTLFYAGFYGGADAKALLFLAVTVPAYPEGFKSLPDYTPPIPVLTVFCNSALLSLVCPVAVSALNLVDLLRGVNRSGEWTSTMSLESFFSWQWLGGLISRG